jgi:drug/metabolite transporter (DMT)-like permease
MAANPLSRTYADELIGIVRDRQRKRTRRQKLGKVVTALILAASRWLLGGLFFMLAVGIAHAEWLPQLPTIGYWWAVLICGLVGSAIARPGPSKEDA